MYVEVRHWQAEIAEELWRLTESSLRSPEKTAMLPTTSHAAFLGTINLSQTLLLRCNLAPFTGATFPDKMYRVTFTRKDRPLTGFDSCGQQSGVQSGTEESGFAVALHRDNCWMP
ncbi:unnamed protein product [Litomosoides sigmodontis]|uniref:Uncharacterized protein n=1 Tax=Litomosoides sigmodontis TaxID=42156 RepID=A0A3P6UV59_LITSI|nr:unnamed protein product [Litomosoides sigmodontis]